MNAVLTPIAVSLNFTRVAFAQLSSGRWVAVIWSKADGSPPLGGEGGEGGGAIIASFGSHQRDGAIAHAPGQLSQFSPCRLRRVDL